MKILRFGDIAAALEMSKLLEGGTGINHDVSGHLLVRSEGRRAIMAHARDQARREYPVPEDLRQSMLFETSLSGRAP